MPISKSNLVIHVMETGLNATAKQIMWNNNIHPDLCSYVYASVSKDNIITNVRSSLRWAMTYTYVDPI